MRLLKFDFGSLGVYINAKYIYLYIFEYLTRAFRRSAIAEARLEMFGGEPVRLIYGSDSRK